MRVITARRMTGAAVTVALMAVAAQISVPLPFLVPVTLQVPVMLAAGLILGPYTAAASMAVYLFMGVIGLPVFANFGGGAAYIFKPSFGFLTGFIPASLLAGFLPRLEQEGGAALPGGTGRNRLPGSFTRRGALPPACRNFIKLGAPVLALYAIGLPYQFIALYFYNGFSAADAFTAVTASSGVFLLADILKTAPLALMYERLVSLRKFTVQKPGRRLLEK